MDEHEVQATRNYEALVTLHDETSFSNLEEAKAGFEGWAQDIARTECCTVVKVEVKETE